MNWKECYEELLDCIETLGDSGRFSNKELAENLGHRDELVKKAMGTLAARIAGGLVRDGVIAFQQKSAPDHLEVAAQILVVRDRERMDKLLAKIEKWKGGGEISSSVVTLNGESMEEALAFSALPEVNKDG